MKPSNTDRRSSNNYFLLYLCNKDLNANDKNDLKLYKAAITGMKENDCFDRSLEKNKSLKFFRNISWIIA